MWQGFKNWQSGLRERLSGNAPAMSGILSSYRSPGITGNMMYQDRTNSSMIPSFMDSYANIKKVLGAGQMPGPMSQKYIRQLTPSHGAGAPIPRGDLSSAMSTPYKSQGNLYE